MTTLNRREWMKAGTAGLALAAGAAGAPAAARAAAPATGADPDARPAAKAGPKAERWTFALNTSTIRPASLEEKVQAVAGAGYDGIELWADDLARHEQAGGSLADLAKRLRDLGLAVPNIIGLWNAMPPTDEEKAKGLDGLRQRMRLAAAVGAGCIAAVPGPDRPDIDVRWAAARYRELLDLGREIGVRVGLEFLGPMKGVHTLGQAAAIAMEADRPDACVVADTFHMYRGGSAWGGLKFVRGSLYAVWHVNDVPRQPAQFDLKDSDRVYPGEGILPLAQVLRDLWAGGFRGPLSLELFHREEWKKPPGEVAKRGLEAMRRMIAAAGVGA